MKDKKYLIIPFVLFSKHILWKVGWCLQFPQQRHHRQISFHPSEHRNLPLLDPKYLFKQKTTETNDTERLKRRAQKAQTILNTSQNTAGTHQEHFFNIITGQRTGFKESDTRFLCKLTSLQECYLTLCKHTKH